MRSMNMKNAMSKTQMLMAVVAATLFLAPVAFAAALPASPELRAIRFLT